MYHVGNFELIWKAFGKDSHSCYTEYNAYNEYNFNVITCCNSHVYARIYPVYIYKSLSIIIPCVVFILLRFAFKQAYFLSSIGLIMLFTYSVNHWSVLCQRFVNNWFLCSLRIFLPLFKCSQTQYFTHFFSCADSISTRSSSDSHIV